jgi:hypothetical protein
MLFPVLVFTGERIFGALFAGQIELFRGKMDIPLGIGFSRRGESLRFFVSGFPEGCEFQKSQSEKTQDPVPGILVEDLCPFPDIPHIFNRVENIGVPC